MNINIDFDNPSVRLPLAFVLDTSGSMEWDNPKPIDLLNEGLKHFKTTNRSTNDLYNFQGVIITFSFSLR